MNGKVMAIAAAFIAVLLAHPAEARHRHHRQHKQPVIQVNDAVGCSQDNNGRTICLGPVATVAHAVSTTAAYAVATHQHRRYARISYSVDDTLERIVGGRPARCPYAYCGCGTSLHIFGRIIPELNLAANWRRFQSASCGPGMAAWRWGHVFAIESCNGDGTVVAYDSNSGGHRTRIHTISLRGYHIVNPQLSRLASR